MPFNDHPAAEKTHNDVQSDGTSKKEDLIQKNDENLCLNKSVVSALRQLSQLMKIADDTFRNIETECRSVFEKTQKLYRRIKVCQYQVKNLDSTSVKVPARFLLSGETEAVILQLDNQACDKSSIWETNPRLPATNSSSDLTHTQQPFLPEVISGSMVASEAQVLKESNGSSHIYCKSLKIKDALNRDTSSRDSEGSKNESINSDVPFLPGDADTDACGKPISKMSSLRRSLINVDFLTWRKKKKEIRRNSIGGRKCSFKDSVNEDGKVKNILPNTKQTMALTKNGYNIKRSDVRNDKTVAEQNNNETESQLNPSITNKQQENPWVIKEKDERFTSKNKSPKCQIRFNELAQRKGKNTRKLKSHIPISTVSAAMNVAVEMRHSNNQTTFQQSNNIPNSNHSVTKEGQSLPRHIRSSHSHLITNGDNYQEIWETNIDRFEVKYGTSTIQSTEKGDNKTVEACSSTSSESISTDDKIMAFVDSSDEREDDLQYTSFLTQKYGSSTSLISDSDGSLNSFLSETGTEIMSSTNTLTSIGYEQNLNIHPPPPMIISATAEEKSNQNFISQQPSIKGDINVKFKPVKTNNELKNAQEQKPHKPEKKSKLDFFGLPKHAINSRKIFTSIVSLKPNYKGKKEIDKRKHITSISEPAFDMYGYHSPKLKQAVRLINERPLYDVQHEDKSNMKSFQVHTTPSSIKELTHTEPFEKSYNNEEPCINHSQLLEVSVKSPNKPPSIPQKYEHQVTVTPINRYKVNQTMNNKGPDYQENHAYTNANKLINEIPPRNTSFNSDNHQTLTYKRHTFSDKTSKEKAKTAARVMLDFDGKVIYSTTSLDRKNQKIKSSSLVHSSAIDRKFDLLQDNNQFYRCDCFMRHANSEMHKILDNGSKLDISCHNKQLINSQNSSLHKSITNQSNDSRQMHNNKLEPINKCTLKPNTENTQNFVPRKAISKSYSSVGVSLSKILFNSTSNKLLPNPNISGLPEHECMSQKHIVQHPWVEESNDSVFKENSDTRSKLFCSPPPFESNESSEIKKSSQSTMSSEDLFALIYNYKKRMNIKTDLDTSTSSSSSSLSSFPACNRPTSSKSILAETGFLSPRNHAQLETRGDRRSWADFRPVDHQSRERKSLASDRFGPPKPTSMHDFKMLLLQTRSNCISVPHKSAVEMLKSPHNQHSMENIKSPPISSSASIRNSISFPISNKSFDVPIHNGHSTVPFKRGNKLRTSLQAQYTIYPPIFEDCSEDLEINNDKGNKNITYARERETNKNGEWSSKKNSCEIEPTA